MLELSDDPPQFFILCTLLGIMGLGCQGGRTPDKPPEEDTGVLDSDGDGWEDDDDNRGWYNALPKFPNDCAYSDVHDYAVEDMDVLMLYEEGDNGYSSDELNGGGNDGSIDDMLLAPGSRASFMLGAGGEMMRAANMHPKEWFGAFRVENTRDHL